MTHIKKEYRKFSKKSYNSFILAGDIGGTNTNLGVFGVKNKVTLLLSFHFKSRELKNIYYAVNEALNYIKKNYKISITKACFGVAGAVSPKRDYVHLTNAGLSLSVKEALARTKLKKIFIMNDFEAVGYGISMLSKNDVKSVKKAKKIPKAPIVVVGAGTGLGKALLVYNDKYETYMPLPSESHHGDFPAQKKDELELVDFIKKFRKTNVVSNGDVVSGVGLKNIYYFLRQNKRFNETKFTKEVDESANKPELISKYRKIDKTCKTAFEIFKEAYAKFAKNMAIDALAFGGVYIGGGIALKNKDIFDKHFIQAFENSHKMGHVLRKIPIYLILNHNVGLLGAGFAGAKLLE